MKQSIFIIEDQQTHEKWVSHDEPEMFILVKNIFDTVTTTPVLTDYYYNDVPNPIPDTEYIIIESPGFCNWKLYKIVTVDKGWIRSSLKRRLELVKEITCEQVNVLEKSEDYETRKRNFIIKVGKLLNLNEKISGIENKKANVFKIYDQFMTPLGKKILASHSRLAKQAQDKLHEMYYYTNEDTDLEELKIYHKKIFGTEMKSKEEWDQKSLGEIILKRF
jgi:hypothetical protein